MYNNPYFCKVPSVLKRASKILFEGTAMDVEKLLPIELKRVQSFAENSKSKSAKVVEKYDRYYEMTYQTL